MVYALLAIVSLSFAVSVIILFRQRKSESPYPQPIGIAEITPKPEISVTNQASQETKSIDLQKQVPTIMPSGNQDFPTLKKGAQCALASVNIGFFVWKLTEDVLRLSAVHRKLLGLPDDANESITEVDFYNRIINDEKDRVKTEIESCKSGHGKKITYHTWHGQRQKQKLCTHIYHSFNENNQGYLIGFSHIHHGDCQQEIEQIDSTVGRVIDLCRNHAFQAGNIDYFEAYLNKLDYEYSEIEFHNPSSSLLKVSGKRRLKSLASYFNEEGYAEFIKAIECGDCTGEDQLVDLF